MIKFHNDHRLLLTMFTERRMTSLTYIIKDKNFDQIPNYLKNILNILRNWPTTQTERNFKPCCKGVSCNFQSAECYQEILQRLVKWERSIEDSIDKLLK